MLDDVGLTKGEFKSEYLKTYVISFIVIYIITCFLNKSIFLPSYFFGIAQNAAISLIKTAIFSSDEEELTFYTGDVLDLKMKDIIDLNYSMTGISCPSCGASFDATKIKRYPYCGNEYDLISDDWELTELKYI